MKHMAVTVIDRLFVVVYGATNPTDDEWRGYLDRVKRDGIERTMQLVHTDGGGPTIAQRGELNELLGGLQVPVAVVTGSARVLLTVTALSWFNRRIRAFPPSGLCEAIAYLEIPASRTDLIRREIVRLQEALGPGRQATG
jgi:hypothetical protein